MAETMGKMMKRAFTWHWHLLGLSAGALFALMSGNPNLLAVLAALEIGYLGFVGMNQRFQNVLRGKTLLEEKAEKDASSQMETLNEVMRMLSAEDAIRFSNLRKRCSELLQLRRSLDRGGLGGVESFRTESLDKMLWFFLKILNQKAGIERFLASTDRDKVVTDREAARQRLAAIEEGSNPRLETAIRDQLSTIDERLANYDKASGNLMVVVAELEKTEQKIKHICESGVTGMDAGELSMRIDSISDTLRNSEEEFVPPGLRSILDEEAPPSFISKSVGMATE